MSSLLVQIGTDRFVVQSIIRGIRMSEIQCPTLGLTISEMIGNIRFLTVSRKRFFRKRVIFKKYEQTDSSSHLTEFV